MTIFIFNRGVVFINIIKVVLKVKSPSMAANELDFTQKTEEILEAVNVFNDKFRDWSKRIIITQITKRAMHLLLVMEKSTVAENLSVREIRYFIQYIRNSKGWNIYTKEKNKMFETVEFSRLDKNTTIIHRDKVIANEVLYRAQKQDIDFMSEAETIKVIADNQIVEMSDEDMITVLEFLTKTKDKGKKSGDKIGDIEKIKTILSRWL